MSGGAPRPASGAEPRARAARAVDRVLAAGRTLDDALAETGVDQVAGPDRALARALAFGAVRWHHRHRRLLALLLDRPLPPRATLLEALLSVGLYQLLESRQPDYAAVHATVEAARLLGIPRAAGLVNASLRRLQREREALLGQVLADDAGRWSAPAWLVENLRRDWPDDHAGVLDAMLEAPPLWLRVNTARRSPADALERLRAAGLAATTLEGAPAAIRLAEPVPVAQIPGFAEGELSVQDAASQLAAPLLAPEPGMRVLDACAAPGGKATHLLELAGGVLDLLALDQDGGRLARVGANLARLGLAAPTREADATTPSAWWDGRPFDRILLDAPCSGSGVIRRHPDIKLLRRPGDIATLAARQRALLDALWPLVAPGGRLLYVTCSVLRAENDAVVGAFLRSRPDATPGGARMPAWARPASVCGWQVLPGTADTDGLYYALIIRSRD